jgi:hypothetical protein
MFSRRFMCKAAMVAAVGFVLVPAASAASRVTGCFTYDAAPVTGLSTNLEYLTVSNTWRYLGAPAATDRNGCVTYSIWSRAWKTYSVRIRATAFVPEWRALFSGATPYYAPGGAASYRLGAGAVSLYVLPASAPPEPSFDGVTNGWLDQMTSGGGGGGCSSAPAMLVACYMDAHRLDGNVVVLDRDHDYHEDDVDRAPDDPSRW